MKKFTRIFVILGAVLCLCGSAVAAAGYLGGGFRELYDKASPRIAAASASQGQEKLTSSPQNQENLTFSSDEIDRLEFRLNSEDIVFRPSEDGQIHIRYFKRDDVTYKAYTEQGIDSDAGNTLVFTRTATSGSTQLFYFGSRYESEAPDVQVALPKGLSVDLITASGDVELNGISVASLSIATVSGEVDLTQVQVDSLAIGTTSGDMDLEQTTAAGETVLTTTSGETELEDCTLNRADFTSVSGDLSGHAVIAGDITVGTTSGDVELDLSGSPAHAAGEISTTSGEMNLQGLQPKSEYFVNITTVSGDITILH